MVCICHILEYSWSNDVRVSRSKNGIFNTQNDWGIMMKLFIHTMVNAALFGAIGILVGEMSGGTFLLIMGCCASIYLNGVVHGME